MGLGGMLPRQSLANAKNTSLRLAERTPPTAHFHDFAHPISVSKVGLLHVSVLLRKKEIQKLQKLRSSFPFLAIHILLVEMIASSFQKE